MPKLQHQSRRGPDEFISVAGQRIELDDKGIVEVSKEAAGKLLQGAKWRVAGTWGDRLGLGAAGLVAMPEIVNGARAARSTEQLRAVAGASGVSDEEIDKQEADAKKAGDKRAEVLAEAKAKTDADAKAQADAAASKGEDDQGTEAEISVSDKMTKKELLAAAKKAGIKADMSMTKSEILDEFEAQT